MIPVLLRPKLLTIRNRWRVKMNARSQVGRDFILALFALGVMLAIYGGTSSALESMNKGTQLAYLPPSLPLGMILMMLLVMLLFSNSVAAIGTLFLGKDLDLILSAPVSSATFFWGRFLEVLSSSSWMTIIFGLPAILAFGQAYHANWVYYVWCVAVLIPFFIIPTALSIILVTIFTSFIPASKTKGLLLIICVFCLAAVFLLVQILDPSVNRMRDSNDILKMLSVLALPNTWWVPSYWASVCLGESLEHTQRLVWPYCLLLASVASALSSAAYLSVRLLHARAYSQAKSTSTNINLGRSRSKRRFGWIAQLFDQQYFGLVNKEIKSFARDVTQAVQLIMLLGLCIIYLYNFRMLEAVQSLPDGTKIVWQSILVVANVAMGAFVITAVCTRFVFPSLSLEGASFWIIQSSPLTLYDLLRAKFWCWLLPVATISSVIFSSGALAINAEPHIVIINGLACWIICYGIVGLAVGLGAFFSNFDWEHASQLAASFGSLVFMILSTILITINMLPVSILVVLRTLRTSGYQIERFDWYLYISLTALLLAYLNFATTRWSLRLGERALLQRM